MADALVLEFSGVGEAEYDAVNTALGIDTNDPASDWPAGIRAHAAGPTSDGGWAVIETWESQADQAKFMETRLGPALQAGGLPSPSRVTWIPLVADSHIGG